MGIVGLVNRGREGQKLDQGTVLSVKYKERTEENDYRNHYRDGRGKEEY